MKYTFFALFPLCLVLATEIQGQESPELKGYNSINQNVIKAQLEFLSSDWMEGRRAGEKGELISSDYIASMLKLYGIKPYGDKIRSVNALAEERSYFQSFVLLKSTAGAGQSLQLLSENGNSSESVEFTYGIDFILRPAASLEVKAPVIFAGYGFKNNNLKINELEGLDLKGKFILKVSGVPAFARQNLTAEEVSAAQTEFENIAEKSGAAGIIEFNPAVNTIGRLQPVADAAPSERNPRPFDVYSSYSIPGNDPDHRILRITVTPKVAEEILWGTDINCSEYITKADKNEKYAYTPNTGKSINAGTSVTVSTVGVRNVVGIIEGNNTKEFIVLGAHFDHMGSNHGYIWNGADDNGSGTVGVMTLARAIMETGKKPEKTIIIALWTAEEEGLLGSQYFVRNFDQVSGKIILNVNFDMISRYISEQEKNKVVMTYTSSKREFRDITTANLKKYKIDLDVDFQPSDNPPGGSDHRSFVAAGIPVMRFKPGHREEYHTPADEISTINWDIMEKIIKISFANIWQIADSR